MGNETTFLTPVEWNLLRREIADELGIAMLGTCWCFHCNDPVAAVLKNSDGRVVLLCRWHAKRAEKGKMPASQKMMSYEPKPRS